MARPRLEVSAHGCDRPWHCAMASGRPVRRGGDGGRLRAGRGLRSNRRPGDAPGAGPHVRPHVLPRAGLMGRLPLRHRPALAASRGSAARLVEQGRLGPRADFGAHRGVRGPGRDCGLPDGGDYGGVAGGGLVNGRPHGADVGEGPGKAVAAGRSPPAGPGCPDRRRRVHDQCRPGPRRGDGMARVAPRRTGPAGTVAGRGAHGCGVGPVARAADRHGL